MFISVSFHGYPNGLKGLITHKNFKCIWLVKFAGTAHGMKGVTVI